MYRVEKMTCEGFEMDVDLTNASTPGPFGEAYQGSKIAHDFFCVGPERYQWHIDTENAGDCGAPENPADDSIGWVFRLFDVENWALNPLQIGIVTWRRGRTDPELERQVGLGNGLFENPGAVFEEGFSSEEIWLLDLNSSAFGGRSQFERERWKASPIVEGLDWSRDDGQAVKLIRPKIVNLDPAAWDRSVNQKTVGWSPFFFAQSLFRVVYHKFVANRLDGMARDRNCSMPAVRRTFQHSNISWGVSIKQRDV
jgi:hypothetical protein